MKVTLLSIEFAPSIGLRSIQQFLLDKGHDVRLIHIPMQRVDKDFIDKVSQEIIKFCRNDGLIGISCMANTFIPGSRLVELIKSKLSTPIIMGGVHPTFKPEECLEYADYICLLEGEHATLELIEKLEKGQRTDNIKNIWVKKNKKIIRNDLRPLITDLDSLPIPCFDFERFYLWHNDRILNIEKNPALIRKFFTYFYSIITSKGCPYHCKYCGNDALCRLDIKHRIIRRRSWGNILQELRIVKQRFGNIFINFTDDDFGARSLKDLKEFFKIYKKKIGLKFFCALTPTSTTEDKLKLLIESGLERIQIGIQSINNHVNREIYGRPIGKEQILKLVKLASKYRHKALVCYDIILDNPWEKDETKIETLKFLFTLKKPYEIWLYSITLYPGTSFYERAKKEGLIKDEKEQVYNKSFFALESNSTNSLFLLFVKFRFPAFIIKALLYLRRFQVVEKILKKSTYPLLHLHFYLQGFQNALKLKNPKIFLRYLGAPARLIILLLKGKKRTKV